MNIEAIQKLIEFDTPTVANGLELLGMRDPAAGYTGPDVRALMLRAHEFERLMETLPAVDRRVRAAVDRRSRNADW